MKSTSAWCCEAPATGSTAPSESSRVGTPPAACVRSFTTGGTWRSQLTSTSSKSGIDPTKFPNYTVIQECNFLSCFSSVNVMLPGYDKHGRRVFIQRLSIADPHKYKYPDVLKVSLMNGDITISDFTFQDEAKRRSFKNPYSIFCQWICQLCRCAELHSYPTTPGSAWPTSSSSPRAGQRKSTLSSR